MLAGNLIVKPVCAQLSIDTDFFTKMDPYVKIRVGAQQYKTKAAKNMGKRPQWQESFTFNIDYENQLNFEIYDKDITIDDYIGYGTVDLGQVLLMGRMQEWYPVFTNKIKKKGLFNFKGLKNAFKNKKYKGHKHKSGKCVGEIMFLFEFTPKHKPNMQMGHGPGMGMMPPGQFPYMHQPQPGMHRQQTGQPYPPQFGMHRQQTGQPYPPQYGMYGPQDGHGYPPQPQMGFGYQPQNNPYAHPPPPPNYQMQPPQGYPPYNNYGHPPY